MLWSVLNIQSRVAFEGSEVKKKPKTMASLDDHQLRQLFDRLDEVNLLSCFFCELLLFCPN